MVLILKHAIGTSIEQTSMRTNWFKHIAIWIVQERLLFWVRWNTQTSAKERKCPQKSANASPQKSAKGQKGAKERKYCKPAG